MDIYLLPQISGLTLPISAQDKTKTHLRTVMNAASQAITARATGVNKDPLS